MSEARQSRLSLQKQSRGQDARSRKEQEQLDRALLVSLEQAPIGTAMVTLDLKYEVKEALANVVDQLPAADAPIHSPKPHRNTAKPHQQACRTSHTTQVVTDILAQIVCDALEEAPAQKRSSHAPTAHKVSRSTASGAASAQAAGNKQGQQLHIGSTEGNNQEALATLAQLPAKRCEPGEPGRPVLATNNRCNSRARSTKHKIAQQADSEEDMPDPADEPDYAPSSSSSSEDDSDFDAEAEIDDDRPKKKAKKALTKPSGAAAKKAPQRTSSGMRKSSNKSAAEGTGKASGERSKATAGRASASAAINHDASDAKAAADLLLKDSSRHGTAAAAAIRANKASDQPASGKVSMASPAGKPPSGKSSKKAQTATGNSAPPSTVPNKQAAEHTHLLMPYNTLERTAQPRPTLPRSKVGLGLVRPLASPLGASAVAAPTNNASAAKQAANGGSLLLGLGQFRVAGLRRPGGSKK